MAGADLELTKIAAHHSSRVIHNHARCRGAMGGLMFPLSTDNAKGHLSQQALPNTVRSVNNPHVALTKSVNDLLLPGH
ncbi:hypothetical protein HK19_15570 [Acetobacter persici]|nr:hypothetical protein HK19_15570 [Acetobacter persici]